MRVIPLGLCLRTIVNEAPLNLEKTTASVLSVLLLIYESDSFDYKYWVYNADKTKLKK